MAIHRLFFHPLSGFPGPLLAGATSLYKTYYDVFKGGEMLQKTHELHSIYGAYFFEFRFPQVHLGFFFLLTGPVVRIGPNEVS